MLCREGTQPCRLVHSTKTAAETVFSEEDYRGLGQGIDQTAPDGSVTVYAPSDAVSINKTLKPCRQTSQIGHPPAR